MLQELVVNEYNWHKPISLSNIPTYYYLKASLEISSDIYLSNETELEI